MSSITLFAVNILFMINKIGIIHWSFAQLTTEAHLVEGSRFCGHFLSIKYFSEASWTATSIFCLYFPRVYFYREGRMMDLRVAYCTVYLLVKPDEHLIQNELLK